MDGKTIVDLCRKHTMFSWSSGANVNPLPVVRAEGVYFWTADGKRYLDFASQAVSVNIGHGHPAVRKAMREGADELIFAGPGCATESRARIGELLAGIMPGDLKKFFFTLGGAEAVENAIRMARLFTGREKVLGRYRSYHGATHATLALGGDARRRHVSPLPGFVQVMDIEPEVFSFGTTDAEKTERYLRYLDEVIRTEGADQIAALFVETVPGTNGVIVPPPGYLKPVADLLKQHGILLVCDEVLTGFGRTGKMFAFEHQNVMPDLVTMAKGLTSSYVPLGCVAVSERIAKHFEENVFWGGLTYNAHPFLLRVSAAAIQVVLDEGLVENSAVLGRALTEQLAGLRRHRSVKDVRSIGLLGAIEISPSLLPTPLTDPDRPSNKISKQIVQGLRDKGVYALLRFNNLMVAPPLCIDHQQLADGVAQIDQQLTELDALVP